MTNFSSPFQVIPNRVIVTQIVQFFTVVETIWGKLFFGLDISDIKNIHFGGVCLQCKPMPIFWSPFKSNKNRSLWYTGWITLIFCVIEAIRIYSFKYLDVRNIQKANFWEVCLHCVAIDFKHCTIPPKLCQIFHPILKTIKSGHSDTDYILFLHL